eukprot:1753554-Pyramimonas_sp.AAC.1
MPMPPERKLCKDELTDCADTMLRKLPHADWPSSSSSSSEPPSRAAGRSRGAGTRGGCGPAEADLREEEDGKPKEAAAAAEESS